MANLYHHLKGYSFPFISDYRLLQMLALWSLFTDGVDDLLGFIAYVCVSCGTFLFIKRLINVISFTVRLIGGFRKHIWSNYTWEINM